MGDVVSIDRRPYRPASAEFACGDPDVIEWAQSLLSKARAGTIDGFVVVANCADGSVIHMHVGNVRRVAVVGGLCYMQSYLNQQIQSGPC